MVTTTAQTTATVLPGTLLPYSSLYAQLASTLPRGSVLVVFPAAESRQRRALESLALQLQSSGHHVTTMVDDAQHHRGSLQAALPLGA